MVAGSKGPQKAWEYGHRGSFKGSATEAPVAVVTYDDSTPGQVAPVSAEPAEAAFNDACGDSFRRHEDTAHPGSHIGQSGVTHSLFCCSRWTWLNAVST